MMDNNKTAEAKDSIFNKCFLKINRSSGNITINGDPIPAYSYDELQILKTC